MLASKKWELELNKLKREGLALDAKDTLDENEKRRMDELGSEIDTLIARHSNAITMEDLERREAGEELETREETERREIESGVEGAQIVRNLDDGSPMDGATAEWVQEMRSKGSYQGNPFPWGGLEQRAGESVAAGVPDPKVTRPIIDRVLANSVAARMGAKFINIPSGQIEWPVATQGASGSWAATELGDVGSAQAFTTIDRPLKPTNTFGAQMVISRTALLQSGNALEQAIRRDMNSTVSVGLDKAIFLGAGSSGEPLGVIPGQASYGFDLNLIDAAATYAIFRDAATEFLTRNAGDYKDIRLLMRTELLDQLDDALYSGTAVSELDRLAAKLGKIVTTSNALDAPTGAPLESTAVMTCSTGGVAPIFVGTWGAIDLIRDVYTKAKSGQLILTALVTADVTASRSEQVTIITELQ